MIGDYFYERPAYRTYVVRTPLGISSTGEIVEFGRSGQVTSHRAGDRVDLRPEMAEARGDLFEVAGPEEPPPPAKPKQPPPELSPAQRRSAALAALDELARCGLRGGGLEHVVEHIGARVHEIERFVRALAEEHA